MSGWMVWLNGNPCSTAVAHQCDEWLDGDPKHIRVSLVRRKRCDYSKHRDTGAVIIIVPRPRPLLPPDVRGRKRADDVGEGAESVEYLTC